MENTKELTKSEKINLDIKQIAKLVKEHLKKEFPLSKFSVSIERYSGGQSLTVALMSCSAFQCILDKDFSGYSQLNHYYIVEAKDGIGYSSNGVRMTEECAKMLIRAVEIVNQYNWDDSDPMTDYFSVNFYLHLNIGKWNKPFVNSFSR